jgi:SpoVK/Ycf46/Vps4 family AAA+-type ATPase
MKRRPNYVEAEQFEFSLVRNTPEPVIEIPPSDDDADVVELPPDAETRTDHRNPRRRRREEQEPEQIGTLIEPDPLRHSFDRVILHEKAKSEIMSGLRAMRLRDEMERVWGINAIQPQRGRCIFNFYGDPGTGKTFTALAIANAIGKRLYQVDYAGVISKYLGDTAKHIKAAFAAAREADAVLFFDEADSLLSRRVETSESCSTSINQNRNVLMQELDRFDGIVIVTTNLFGNYDPALLRRIQRHIKFELPNAAMRRALLELHLPKRQRVRADLANVAREALGLSGGDLLNVCVNSMHAASTDDDSATWLITEAILLAQVEAVRHAKREHNGAKRSQSAIGFNMNGGAR